MMFLERMMRFFNGFPVVSAPKSMKEVKIDFRGNNKTAARIPQEQDLRVPKILVTKQQKQRPFMERCPSFYVRVK